jgi:hypothetical protein
MLLAGQLSAADDSNHSISTEDKGVDPLSEDWRLTYPDDDECAKKPFNLFVRWHTT